MDRWYMAAVAGRVLKLLQYGTSDGGIVYLCTWDITYFVYIAGYSLCGSMVFMCVWCDGI